MSAEEILRSSEDSAANSLGNNDGFTTRVVGNTIGSRAKKKGPAGAIGLIALMAVVFVVVFSSGNLIPTAISERLIEATDVQYADAVESKMLVFQQALSDGNIPENTVKRLNAHGVEVSGNSLIFRGETIAASNFINKVHSDAALYEAFTAATYGRAAYYYDEAAENVFKKIGTSRDNYQSGSDFDETMQHLVGDGSDISVSNVLEVEKMNDEGQKYIDYEVAGETADSNDSGVSDFIRMVAENNLDESSSLATKDAATALNNADITMKEQKSSIFFMGLMENISKMKAGVGNESKINEAMNLLFREQESSVVDIETGEIITTRGSMLEAPSLYAILAGEKVDVSKVTNYASDRVLKTAENNGVGEIDDEVRNKTLTSTDTKNRGTIGRFLDFDTEAADYNALSSVTPTIDSSLFDNGFDSIGGIYGGELLVEGAVNVGRILAKASGAAAGDDSAVKSYAKTTSDILALDAEVDRMNRSPFDISSKNTFLGSIIHKFATAFSKNLSGGVFSVFGTALSTAVSDTTPNSYADDAGTMYLTNFGTDCKTLQSIGAAGSASCSEIATFDTSTLNDTFHDDGFLAFVEENTTMENGTRKVKKDSDLADFIKYNNERITPMGLMDGGILESINNNSSSIPFVSNIVSMIKSWLGASDEDKAIATGKVFVNSSSNPEWGKYKYAQRYVSLARATDTMRQYDGDETAYNNIPFFEGEKNPVIAFLNDYYEELAANF